MRAAWIWLLRAAGALVSALIVYLVVALVAALAPSTGRVQTLLPGDPAILVCTSLAHTDIVVPVLDEASGWRRLFPEIAAVAPYDAYLAIGWGDLGVYRNTPRWRDLRPGVALSAMLGLGPTTLHVVAVRPRGDEAGCRHVRIDRAGRRALGDFIAATARLGPGGAAHLIEQTSWGEAYYAANGRYSPWRTCNVWASQALEAAGLPTAIFAPFSFGVDWPLSRVAER